MGCKTYERCTYTVNMNRSDIKLIDENFTDIDIIYRYSKMVTFYVLLWLVNLLYCINITLCKLVVLFFCDFNPL